MNKLLKGLIVAGGITLADIVTGNAQSQLEVPPQTFKLHVEYPTQASKHTIDSVNTQYNALCSKIIEKRDFFRKTYSEAQTLEEKTKIEGAAQKYIENSIIQLTKLWMGTEYDFYGYTEKPLRGRIACGYLVTTPLKHMGLLNEAKRKEIAQQFPENVTHALDDSQTILEDISYEKLVSYLNKSDKGLYIGGIMGCHVGYFLKDSLDSYFIHADPVSGKVSKDKLSEQDYLKEAVYPLTIGKIGSKVTKAWLENQNLKVSHKNSKYK